MNDIIVLILSYLGLNFLIFLPNWFTGLGQKEKILKKNPVKGKPFFILKKLIYERFSPDFLRISLDIFFILCIALILGIIDNQAIHIILVFWTVFSFSYHTYIWIIIRIFKKRPIFVSDIEFAKTGITVITKNSICCYRHFVIGKLRWPP